jgi:hypothetical protein
MASTLSVEARERIKRENEIDRERAACGIGFHVYTDSMRMTSAETN